MNREDLLTENSVQYCMKNIEFLTGRDVVCINPARDHLKITFNTAKFPGAGNGIDRLSDLVAYYYLAPHENAQKYSSVTTIFYELIRNAIYYSKNGSSIIELETWREDHRLFIKIINEVTRKDWNILKELFDGIFSNDPDSIYTKKIKEYRNKRTAPGMGLFLLKRDHYTRMNLKVFEDESERLWVTITADVKIS
jgi:hypothetical protein